MLGHRSDICTNPAASRERQTRWREEAALQRLARAQKELEEATKTVQCHKSSPAVVKDEVSGTGTGKPKDKRQVLEDNFRLPPSDEVAKPLEKSSIKGGIGSKKSLWRSDSLSIGRRIQERSFERLECSCSGGRR